MGWQQLGSCKTKGLWLHPADHMPDSISTARDICGSHIQVCRKECDRGWFFSAGASGFVVACHPMLV